MKNESFLRVVTVALAVCVVCALCVSMAAIVLRPQQQRNAKIERDYNILTAAGIIDSSDPDGKKLVPERISQVQARLVDLDTGELLEQAMIHRLGLDNYQQRKAEKDPTLSRALAADEDIASIKRRERYSWVYTVTVDNALKTLILPIRGYGLWSTMRGFIALEGDLNTVVGFGFFEQGETPGLGGEVDNPQWKAQWLGKKLYNDRNQLAIGLVKNLTAANPEYQHKVDALSGASLTTQGVNNLLQYWLADAGFGVFLDNIRNGKVRI